MGYIEADSYAAKRMVIMSKSGAGGQAEPSCEGKPDQDVEVGDLLTIGRSSQQVHA